MDTSITMEIRQTVADVMPVRGDAPVLIPGVGIHRNVIKGVRPTQPVKKTMNNEVNQIRIWEFFGFFSNFYR